MANMNGEFLIQFDDSDFDGIEADVSDYIHEVVKRSAFFLQGEFGENAPVDTGRLRTSFEIGSTDPLFYEVFTLVHYALKVNYNAKNKNKRNYIEKSILNTENEISKFAESLFNQMLS